jgi:hypothetical protein
MIVRNGTISYFSNIITGLKRTSDLSVGMFVYGTGLCPDTSILSVDSSSQVSISKEAKKDITQNLQFTGAGVDLVWDRISGQTDIYNLIDERGDIIKVLFRDESDVSRDSYNSILKRNQNKVIFMKAYPITFQPNSHQLEKAGLRQTCDVLVYTPYLSWNNEGINFEDIEYEGRTRVVLRGNEYEIKEKGVESQLGDSFGYITLGLFKA